MCTVSDKKYTNPLKTLDTFGNCQRPVLSQWWDTPSENTGLWRFPDSPMHKITNLWKFVINVAKENNGRKNTLVPQVKCFRWLELETSAEISYNSNILVRNLLKNCIPNCYQLFWETTHVPIMSSAFNEVKSLWKQIF